MLGKEAKRRLFKRKIRSNNKQGKRDGHVLQTTIHFKGHLRLRRFQITTSRSKPFACG